MANFPISDEKRIELALRMLETTDRGHADVFNALFHILINNDAFLNEAVGNKVDKNKIIHELTNTDIAGIMGADQGPVIMKHIDECRTLLESNYEGRNLTTVLSNEIGGENPWNWISRQINNNTMEGIHIGDYIPLTINGNTYEMQVAGIDTYYLTTWAGVNPEKLENIGLGHHIDFISRHCYSERVVWTTANHNSGTGRDGLPYLSSNIHSKLIEIETLLPSLVKSKITSKRTLLEYRPFQTPLLKESIDRQESDIGKLWIPTEYEVFGSAVWGTKGYSAGQGVQYPLFSKGWKNRIKGITGDPYEKKKRAEWWLATVRGNSSDEMACVATTGYPDYALLDNDMGIPICFRIAGDPVNLS